MKLEFIDGLKSKRCLIGIVLLHMILYLAFCVIFYKDRFYGDGSFVLATVAGAQEYMIPHLRLPRFLLQSPILLMSHLGVSFKWVSIAFSSIYPISFLFVYWLSIRISRKPVLCLGLPLILFVHSSHHFRYPMDELPEAMLYVWLLFIIFNWLIDGEKRLSIVVASVLIALIFGAVFLHPFSILCIIFMLVFEAGVRKRVLSLHFFIFTCSILMFFFRAYIGTSSYESGKIDEKLLAPVFDLIDSGFPMEGLLAVMGETLSVVHLTFGWFHVLPILLVFIFFFFKKKPFVPFLILIFSIGYLIVVATTLDFADKWESYHPHVTYYVEGRYRPIVFFVVIPFIYYLNNQLDKKYYHWLSLMALFLMIHNLFGILISRDFYSERRSVITNIARAPDLASSSKIEMSYLNYGDNYLVPRAFMPFDSMVQTTFDDEIGTKVMRLDRTPGESWRPDINEFIARTSKSGHFGLNSGEFAKANTDWEVRLRFERLNDIVVDVLNFHTIQSNQEGEINLLIRNKSGEVLRSGRNGPSRIYLNYFWSLADEKIVSAPKFLPLMIDVETAFIQKLPIKTPSVPGDYIFTVEWVVHQKTESEEHWHSNVAYESNVNLR